MMNEIIHQLTDGLKATTLPEYIAVFAGVASVWFSKREHILVYPVGLINTTIYIWLSFKGHLLGEASVNFYYTVMSIYGWIMWAKKDREQHAVLHITFSDRRWWMMQIVFFLSCYTVIYLALVYLQKSFAPGAIPWADALASASAFTGMWLMTRKKVESWYWWIVTNVTSIPLYFVKQYVFTSVYYGILLIMAIGGLLAWKQRASLSSAKQA